MNEVVAVAEQLRLIPRRKREHADIALAASQGCDGEDALEILVATLAIEVKNALPVQHVLQQLREEHALGLATAGLAENVAVSAALAFGDIDGTPGTEATPGRRNSDDRRLRRAR